LGSHLHMRRDHPHTYYCDQHWTNFLGHGYMGPKGQLFTQHFDLMSYKRATSTYHLFTFSLKPIRMFHSAKHQEFLGLGMMVGEWGSPYIRETRGDKLHGQTYFGFMGALPQLQAKKSPLQIKIGTYVWTSKLKSESLWLLILIVLSAFTLILKDGE
jgi:hypothetical protein